MLQMFWRARLLFFMGNGIVPMGLEKYEFNRFYPIFKNLVEKGEMKKGVLDCFDLSR
jgi:hypothetical protein